MSRARSHSAYSKDERVVLTLDGGGTNFVFSALSGAGEVVAPLTLPSNAHDLDASLATIVEGFRRVSAQLSAPPVAISFAFPGPASYEQGIIGDLENLPAFRGGVALGPMLEDEFALPVFINNDGDLFAYGEAIAGLLPRVNGMLESHGSARRYRNLLGVTLGTGFGAGIVYDGHLLLGDNGAGAEIVAMRSRLHPELGVEEDVSIRGVRRAYASRTGEAFETAPMPKDIFEIATGARPGHRRAAMEAFRDFGVALGDAIANALTLVDGLVVIGGGISAAHSLFLPATVGEMNLSLDTLVGHRRPRMMSAVHDLEDPRSLEHFLAGEPRTIAVPRTARRVTYDAAQRTGVGISTLGTSRAVAIGAYAFALDSLDRT